MVPLTQSCQFFDGKCLFFVIFFMWTFLNLKSIWFLQSENSHQKTLIQAKKMPKNVVFALAKKKSLGGISARTTIETTITDCGPPAGFLKPTWSETREQLKTQTLVPVQKLHFLDTGNSSYIFCLEFSNVF